MSDELGSEKCGSKWPASWEGGIDWLDSAWELPLMAGSVHESAGWSDEVPVAAAYRAERSVARNERKAWLYWQRKVALSASLSGSAPSRSEMARGTTMERIRSRVCALAGGARSRPDRVMERDREMREWSGLCVPS